jgi:hypothetical protein
MRRALRRMPPAAVRSSSTTRRRLVHGAIVLLAMAAANACAPVASAPVATAPETPPRAVLRAFQDEAALAQYHGALVEELLRRPLPPHAQVQPGPPHPGGAPAAPRAPRDYGEPRVRVHGDYLVVLRGGRLSTFRVAGGTLDRVAEVDALGPAGSSGDVSFRELLVSDAGVQVVAVEDGGVRTHVARFRLGADGRLAHRDGVLIRAAEGPSPGIDAIRQAGDGLVIVHHLDVRTRTADVRQVLPRAWSARAAADTGARATAPPQRVHRSASSLSWADRPVLSTATLCRGPDGELACTSSAVYTPDPEVVHVSPSALYLWTPLQYAVARAQYPERKVLYRLPFDGSAATALPVTGSPQRPESFMESADGHLNVSLLFDGWTPESGSLPPTLALLRVPFSAFGDGTGRIVPGHYRELPRLQGRQIGRFVGDWLVYATRPHTDYIVRHGLLQQAPPEALGIGRVRWAGGDAPSWFGGRTPVAALQAVRPDAAVALVGSGDRPELGYVRLADSIPASAIAVPGIHHLDETLYGIVHQPHGTDAGLLAVTTGVMPDPYSWRATGVAVVRYDVAGMRQIGQLAPRTEPAGQREVVPVFAHGRLFALLGDELVEAVEENGGLREIRRILLP